MKPTILLLVLIGLFSCNIQKEIYVDNPQILSFGTAGGFTNQTIEYKLYSNGKLWKVRSLENDSSLLRHLKSNKTKKIFNQFYKLGLDTLNLKMPGNMNNFIKIKTKTSENKIVWEKGSDIPNSEIIEFYSTMINHTKTQ